MVRCYNFPLPLSIRCRKFGFRFGFALLFRSVRRLGVPSVSLSRDGYRRWVLAFEFGDVRWVDFRIREG